MPWRKTEDAYRILVSEVMLQQTQVERVIPFYQAWLKRFPTIRKLADAKLSDVLSAWQGLGYNRRAKGLWEAARTVVSEYRGKLPSAPEELEQLPGIGPYTARAVAAFAHNRDVIFVETNIRTAVIHHFFEEREGVSDTEIREVLERALPKGRSREWYSALMDYGTYLKRSGVKLNSRSKGYVKQARFKGSGREARGAILRALLTGPASASTLTSLLGAERQEQMEEQLIKLHAEGMVAKSRGQYRLP